MLREGGLEEVVDDRWIARLFLDNDPLERTPSGNLRTNPWRNWSKKSYMGCMTPSWLIMYNVYSVVYI